ncbi:MAG TPA: hypothetical protein VN256_11580 [Pyrinomonadaceae bacterium]|nr:hypothetical protein [Pyrinomonadaceae bacterium]
MAEEGTLGPARASDGEPSKEELQRRMEEARETITQTVTEIKETVTNQYYSMKETVSEALDWRHHFRRNPVAFSVGALAAGFLLGYGVTGALKGRGGRRDDYPSAEDTDVYARTGATPQRYEDEEIERRTAFHGHSFAAQAITDGPRAGGADEAAYERVTDEGGEGESGGYGGARGGSYAYTAPREEGQAEQQQPQKPGLLERFKETSAYDRLQTEVSSLGDRFIEELSSTAQTVVLPALFNKVKELFGVDLSNKQGQGGGGQQQKRAVGGAAAEQSGAEGGAGTGGGGEARAASAAASSSGAASSLASASRGSSTPSYATSENRGYGTQPDERGGAGGTDNSVLDLDR